jgi:hypothetical protein
MSYALHHVELVGGVGDEQAARSANDSDARRTRLPGGGDGRRGQIRERIHHHGARSAVDDLVGRERPVGEGVRNFGARGGEELLLLAEAQEGRPAGLRGDRPAHRGHGRAEVVGVGLLRLLDVSADGLEVLVAARHPVGVQFQALVDVVGGDEDPVVLQEEDRRLRVVVLAVGGHAGADRPGQEVARREGDPQRRALVRAGQRLHQPLAGAAGQGVDLRGVGVDHHPSELSVQRALDRRASAGSATGGGVEALEHAPLALGALELLEAGVEYGQGLLDVHFHPAGGLAHVRQGRAAGLDEHDPAVFALGAGVAAAALDEVDVGADLVRYLEKILKRAPVHSRSAPIRSR